MTSGLEAGFFDLEIVADFRDDVFELSGLEII